MVKREIIRVATAHKKSHWIRQLKEELPSTDPWLKRAIIAGASTFSKDERTHWLRRIEIEKEVTTDLEKLVVKWARTQNP